LKRYLLYTCMIALVIILINIIIKPNSNDKIKVVTAFENGNYLTNTATVESFFYYGDVYLKEEERKEILDNIVKDLGINNQYKYEEILEKESRISRINYTFKGGNLELELSTQENKINNNVYSLNHFISVKMEFENAIQTAWYYKNELEDILKELPNLYIQPEVTISMQGEMQGKMSPVSMKKIGKEIFSQLDAKIVQDNWNQDNTMYGYSESIDTCKSIAGKKVNVNVAFTYDEIRDITTVYVASPIYNGDY